MARKTMAYTVIQNVSDSDFQEIYNYLDIAFAHYAKVYKRNFRPRNFAIEEFWTYNYKNSLLVLDATKKIKGFLACLEMDINKIFCAVENCWRNKSDIYLELDKSYFSCCFKRKYTYQLNGKNKWRWLLDGRPTIYERLPKFDFDDYL